MKIAIILSGQLRNFDECYASFKTNILDHNVCDIYLQTYISEDYGRAIQLYQPFKTILEQPDQDFTVAELCKCSIHNGANGSMYWMHKNNKSVFSIVKKNWYDCVVRTRYDVTYSAPIEFNKFDMDNINIPAGGNWLGGINDLFVFSSYDNMSKYCNLIDYINEYVNNGVMCHAETLLKYHLVSNSLNINRFEFELILRGHSMTSDPYGRP